jgi:hypothetical protein
MASWFKKVFGGSDDELSRSRVEPETHHNPPAKLPPRRDETQPAAQPADVYMGLRQQALSRKPRALGYWVCKTKSPPANGKDSSWNWIDLDKLFSFDKPR